MSQECQQPQAHPARCGCEQKTQYPDRLCHIDYSAHPYHCGCLKGDAEAQRRFDEHKRHASVPPAGGVPEVDLDFSAYRDQCSVTPDDEVTMKRHQANAYMASMKHLGLAERDYLPDAIRALQAESTELRINYTACVHGRQSFRKALREKRAEAKRLQAENAALQQRLNVADQRVNELQRGAELLPEGWMITVEVERDGGGVTLIDPQGNDLDYPSNRESMGDEVEDAIEEALAQQVTP